MRNPVTSSQRLLAILAAGLVPLAMTLVAIFAAASPASALTLPQDCSYSATIGVGTAFGTTAPFLATCDDTSSASSDGPTITVAPAATAASAATSGNHALAFTGFDAGAVSAAGAVLLLLGGSIILMSHRRRSGSLS